jgi:hypothetical protein
MRFIEGGRIFAVGVTAAAQFDVAQRFSLRPLQASRARMMPAALYDTRKK